VLWLACFAFAQQIYLDFSAYADIAIGSARLFGIELSENFKSPYAAANILNFWQRFHITLSSCLRDYVFIPLGGTSRNNLRASLVLAFTMVLVGLWHGVEGHYILFGVYIAFWMVLYRIFRISCNKFRRIKTLRRLKSWHLFGVFLTFFVWMTGAPFFRGQNIESALTMYQTMFFKFDHLSIIFEGQYLYFLGLCLFTHSVHLYRNGQPKTGNYSPVFGGLRLALYCMVIIFFAVDTTSEFIYFQF
jgi:D-alanyl-lipoteichoic acid acyltransferase DltB (MBOAT superfamily)